jgi:hypothetical protein
LRRKVLEIDAVTLAQEGGTLVVRVMALVPSLGWTEPELVPYSIIMPPRDGIYQLDFIASAPEDSPSILSALDAELRMPLPKGLRGVRVHASTNSLVGVL